MQRHTRMICATTTRRRVSLPVLNNRSRRPALSHVSRPRPRTIHLGRGPGAEEVRPILDVLVNALRSYEAGGAPFVVSLSALPASEAAGLVRALGDGEVFIEVRGPRPAHIRETALHGLWLVNGDTLEVADVPAPVRAAALEATRPVPAEPPPSPLAKTLLHRAAAFRPGDPSHVVNLSYLSGEELDALDGWLGRGPVVAESKGADRWRVTLTAHRHVWSVQHRNGVDDLLGDTLEVVEVPATLAAQPEDFADSADRLAALLTGSARI